LIEKFIFSMNAFDHSLRYDKRMHAADIRGSIAYAKALALVGILTDDEKTKITDGLKLVGEEWQTGVVRGILLSSTAKSLPKLTIEGCVA
jgi:argininosuccinate lyase